MRGFGRLRGTRAQCFVVATLASMTPAEPFVFRNYEYPLSSTALAKKVMGLRGSSSHQVWEAVRASSAAPYYLDDFKCGNDRCCALRVELLYGRRTYCAQPKRSAVCWQISRRGGYGEQPGRDSCSGGAHPVAGHEHRVPRVAGDGRSAAPQARKVDERLRRHRECPHRICLLSRPRGRRPRHVRADDPRPQLLQAIVRVLVTSTTSTASCWLGRRYASPSTSGSVPVICAAALSWTKLTLQSGPCWRLPPTSTSCGKTRASTSAPSCWCTILSTPSLGPARSPPSVSVSP